MYSFKFSEYGLTALEILAAAEGSGEENNFQMQRTGHSELESLALAELSRSYTVTRSSSGVLQTAPSSCYKVV